MRYFIKLSYKGTNYHGWQFQNNAKSVQQTIADKLSLLLREKISITGAGRTDTGVHAKNFYAHFDTESQIENPDVLVKKMNGFLPCDIVFHEIFPVKDSFHSRFDAVSRTYKYFIATEKDPFQKEFSFLYSASLELEKMNEAAKLLFEYEDFTSFSKRHTDTKTNLCKICKASWEKNDKQLIFTIKANRFLRNMVRAIVGTLVEVGKGRINLNDFRKIIEEKDRAKAGFSAPAHALFLVEIEYPKNFRKFE